MLLLFLSLFWSLSFATQNRGPVKTIDYLDLNKGCGKWYEIARITHSYEKDLVGVTAEYTMLPNGIIKIYNTARKHTLRGKFLTERGKAWVVDRKTNAKIRASYRWPFNGTYGVIEIGKNYEYAVVGNLNRQSLWIVARKPHMEEKLYQKILKKAQDQGYDVRKLYRTPQPKEKG